MSQPITYETLDMMNAISDMQTKASIKKGFYSPDPLLSDHRLCSQSDVQKWLRDKKKIHIEPQFSRTADDSGYEWWFYLYPVIGGGRIKFFPHEIGEGLTYEGALEIGLQEGLKLIK